MIGVLELNPLKNNVPTWYWTYGLHDAHIVSATIKESAWNPADKQLILNIDCDGVVGESNITQIRFKNFKTKPADFELSLLTGGWWLWDELENKGDHYLLELRFDTKKCKRKNVVLIFDSAEVIRE